MKQKVVHRMFQPKEILAAYNNMEKHPSELSVVELLLILGYLHKEVEMCEFLDKKNGTDTAIGVVLAINDVRQALRSVWSQPVTLAFAPKSEGNA